LTWEAVTKTRYQPNAKMSIGKILLWEATNGLLLIPVWIHVDTMHTRAAGFHQKGLGFSDRPSAGKSSGDSLLVKISDPLVGRGARRFSRVTFSGSLVSHRSLALGFSLCLSFGELRRSGYPDEWADSLL
jgi:hypothetical protein